MRILRVSSLIGAVLPLLTLLSLVSCGAKEKADERIGEAATERILKGATGKDADVDIDGKTVKIKGEGTETTMEETAAWPTDIFPAVPEFTFGKVTRVVKGDDGGMRKFNIYFDDIQEGGVEKYVDLLNGRGWQASLMSSSPKGGMVIGQKDDLSLQFPFSKDRNDGTLIVFSSKTE